MAAWGAPQQGTGDPNGRRTPGSTAARPAGSIPRPRCTHSRGTGHLLSPGRCGRRGPRCGGRRGGLPAPHGHRLPAGAGPGCSQLSPPSAWSPQQGRSSWTQPVSGRHGRLTGRWPWGRGGHRARAAPALPVRRSVQGGLPTGSRGLQLLRRGQLCRPLSLRRHPCKRVHAGSPHWRWGRGAGPERSVGVSGHRSTPEGPPFVTGLSRPGEAWGQLCVCRVRGTSGWSRGRRSGETFGEHGRSISI